MNKEIQSISRNIQNVNSGTPWYGRAVYELLDEIDESITSVKPGEQSHSMIELLYHMITWAEFCLKRIEKDEIQDLVAFEKLDWREIDPQIHGWKEGIAQFKSVHEKIIGLLEDKNDEFLKEVVDYRNYNFRFLLNGLMQHNIYHVAQIVYIKRLLQG